MRLGLFLALIAAAMLFIYIDQGLAAGLCFVAALFIAIGKLGSGGAKAGREVGATLSAGIRQDVSAAEGQVPDVGVLKEGMENAGDLVSQQAKAPDKERFKFKGLGAVGEGCKKIVDGFKRLFG